MTMHPSVVVVTHSERLSLLVCIFMDHDGHPLSMNDHLPHKWHHACE